MILTDYSETKRGNIALFLDGAFAFSISPEAFTAAGLRTGDELDQRTVAELREASDLKKAKDKALTLLSYKQYTSAELEKRLCEHTTPEAASLAVERMEALGLVNDGDYAERYARRLAARGLGERRMRMEMRQKGLPQETVDFALSHLESDPAGRARELLEKKYPLWREDEKIRRRAYAALARRGFGSDDIRRAMGDDYD